MLPPESDQELPTVASTADATTAVPPGSPVPGPGMLTVGQSLGTRYRILALLGRGGMGAVYKAWDDELGLAVALKTILLAPGTDGDTATLLARRFKREALLARQITHQNVVRVHDFGEFEGVKYLTMAFVEGETLSDLMRRRDRLEPREVVPLARQIAEGLSAAHRAGVVHRDLKPANIMITPAGEACIMDFGIARSANTTVTQAGVVVGTLEYMAPEQLLGAAADERTDVYALGLICHDMLLGRHRLDGMDQPMLEALGRARRPLPPVAATRPDIPAPLAALVDKAVHPTPDQRFDSAQAVLDELSTLAADGHRKRDPSITPTPPPGPTWLAHLRRAGLAVALVGTLVAAASFGLPLWRDQAGASTTTAPPPVSVVVAEFANRTGEAVFDGLLDQAMAIGLEGASFINVYPRREALRQVTQLKAPGLDLETSRLIGLREGIPLVVSGRIDAAGQGYHLRVQVHEAAPDGESVFDWGTEASDRDRVLEEVGRMAVQVRRALGDGTVDVKAVNANETFTAASLDAAAEYSPRTGAAGRGQSTGCVPGDQRAVTRDPNLGRAWAGMGTVAYNQRRLEDAERLLREALGHVPIA